MHIKVDDTVEVISGDDRGRQGKVLRVDRAGGKLVVEGMNQVKKHVRRSQRNPQGGRLSMEMPIQICNVLLVCAGCGRRTRTGVRFEEDGSKVRYCKKCGAGIGQISPPKAQNSRK